MGIRPRLSPDWFSRRIARLIVPKPFLPIGRAATKRPIRTHEDPIIACLAIRRHLLCLVRIRG
jgi:hypothetical protein